MQNKLVLVYAAVQICRVVRGISGRSEIGPPSNFSRNFNIVQQTIH